MPECFINNMFNRCNVRVDMHTYATCNGKKNLWQPLFMCQSIETNPYLSDVVLLQARRKIIKSMEDL